MKTNRDIKSGLDIARKRKASSFTQKIEEKMKAELEKELGPILSEEQKTRITNKEGERKVKQYSSLRRSRLKILRVKEKAILRQEARRGPISIKPDLKKVKKSEESENIPRFKKVNIGY